jgi:hypothetical protein
MRHLIISLFLLSACDGGRSVGDPGGTGGGGATDLGSTSGPDLASASGRDQGVGSPDQGAASSPDLAIASDVTVAAGTFVKGQQSGGDTGSGSASLVRHPDGSEVAVFGSDFQSTSIPAGEVVLTSRSAIGVNGIDPSTDLDLGPLKSSQGTQSYVVSGGDGGRRNLFVYCVTYGIDVAVARLQ